MRVLYEPQTFSIQDFGGVSRYFTELLDHAEPDMHCELPVVLSNNLYLRERRHSQHLEFMPGVAVPGAWRLLLYANRHATRRAIRRQNFDVFHPTVNDQTYFLDLLEGKPFVLTIHDMIPALFEEYYGATGMDLTLLATRAARLITVSENTRADVLRLLPVRPERVVVVPHGYRNSTKTPSDAGLPTPSSYLLFIGTRHTYKNFSCLVTAFSQLRAAFPALHLVCAGGGAFRPDELDLLRDAGVDDQVQHFGYLSDAQLNGLYRGAAAFVFPSRYEGFGLPILEAFGQDCPVVLSRASCFPEIAQDAALYFDPHYPAELAEQLARVLTDTDLRAQLIHRGQLRVRDFTWAQTAAATRRVYEDAREDAPVDAY